MSDPTPDEVSAAARAIVDTLTAAENESPEEYARWIPIAARAALQAAAEVRAATVRDDRDERLAQAEALLRRWVRDDMGASYGALRDETQAWL